MCWSSISVEIAIIVLLSFGAGYKIFPVWNDPQKIILGTYPLSMLWRMQVYADTVINVVVNKCDHAIKVQTSGWTAPKKKPILELKHSENIRIGIDRKP